MFNFGFNQLLRAERDNYQREIQLENIRNLRLQNEALSSSIQAMRDRMPGQSTARSSPSPSPSTSTPSTPADNFPSPSTSTPSTPADNFPSLAEIQSMITSSQQKAEKDFMGKINLLRTQQQQQQEEDQLSARNAANRVQSYQRQSAIGAWESALRGR